MRIRNGPRLATFRTNFDSEVRRISVGAGRRPVTEAHARVAAAAHRLVAELGRGGGGRRGAACDRHTASVARVHRQHLYMAAPAEPVRHRPTRPQRRRPSAAGPQSRRRIAVVPATTSAAAQRRLERPPELERHDVVQDRIDHRADVVQDTGTIEEHRLQHLAGVGVLLDVIWTGVDRDETLRMERSPANEESYHDRH